MQKTLVFGLNQVKSAYQTNYSKAIKVMKVKEEEVVGKNKSTEKGVINLNPDFLWSFSLLTRVVLVGAITAFSTS